MGVQTFDARKLVTANSQLDSGSGTAPDEAFIAGPNGCWIVADVATNSDSIDHVVVVAWGTAGFPVQLGSALVPAGAGYGGLPGVDLLAVGLPAGAIPLPLKVGEKWIHYLEVPVSGSGQVMCTALALEL